MRLKARELKDKVRRAFIAYAKAKNLRRSADIEIDPFGYYLTLIDQHQRIIVLSPKPYYRWKDARAAAKRINPSAFIHSGSTLLRKINNQHR